MAIFSIGSAGRAYPDTAAFIADLPATLTEQMRGQHYNDSEFTSTSSISLPNTITTTAAFNIVLECAPGESFRDSGNYLRYDAANGVGIRKTNSYNEIILINTPHTEVIGLQFSTTGIGNTTGVNDRSNTTFIGCIINSSSNTRAIETTGANSTYINNVIIVNEGAAAGAEGIRINYTVPTMINNTIICLFPGSTAFGVEKNGGSANGAVLKNNAIFGFGVAMETGSWGAGTDFNATDNATLPAGSSNLTSLTFAEQFENIAATSTLNLILKAGNDLDGAGTPEALTNDEDIFFSARSLTAPSIGVFEVASGGGGATDYPLIIGSGSYLSTGADVQLRALGNVSVQSGLSALTGNDVGLFVSANIQVNSGSHSLTGSNVTLTYNSLAADYPLTVDSGIYSATGANVNLIAVTKIVVDAGTFTGVGYDVTLTHAAGVVDYPLVIDAGNFTSTGADVGLFGQCVIIADTGSYISIGRTVNLKWSGDSAQTIGTVTAGYVASTYSAGYKVNTITVSFKG